MPVSILACSKGGIIASFIVYKGPESLRCKWALICINQLIILNLLIL